MNDQNSSYVMVEKSPGQYERRDIKVGMDTGEKAEIVEGLKEGDVIAFNRESFSCFQILQAWSTGT